LPVNVNRVEPVQAGRDFKIFSGLLGGVPAPLDLQLDSAQFRRIRRSRRPRVRRQQEGRDGDYGRGEASGVPIGGAWAFEHGDLATGAATTTAVC
jgi:hypothetical protein